MCKKDKKMFFKTVKTVVITALVIFALIGIKDTFFDSKEQELSDIASENSTDNNDNIYESEEDYVEEESEEESEHDKEFKENILKKAENNQQDRRKRDGDALTSKQKLEVMNHGKIPKGIENQFEEDEVFFIPNGYYYHSDIYCDGLKGYYNIKYTTIDNVENFNLKPCNWCN